MPKTVPAAVLTEAQKAANNPIYLIELALSGGTVYLAATNADITFNGHTYNGWGIDFSAVTNQITGGVDRVSVRMDNTGNAMSAHVVGSDWPGRILAIKRVFGNLLSSGSNVMTVFAGTMAAPVVNQSYVEVMALSPMARLNKQAGRLYQNLCPWEYGGTECGDSGSSCDKTLAACAANDNVQRFGGFVYIPRRIL
mgnify:CR=1 FL=1|nr:MAG TPA: minor tail protein [Caudoviricetes sp.]